MNRSLMLACGMALATLLIPAHAMAQQAPVTGRMLGGTKDAMPTPARPATALAPAPAPPSAPVDAARAPTEQGEVTRSLLRMQAAGTHAAPALPVLGDQAHASYARYLKSFEHEIPEFFENTVGESTPGGGN